MKKINKILFPTDFSPNASNAFRYALKVADVFNASVEVVHALMPEYEPADMPVMTGQYTQLKMDAAGEAGRSFVETGFTHIQNNYSFENIPEVDARIEIGTPVNVICHIAQKEEFDLIVMGTQGENQTLDKILGTVASEVVAQAPCDVLVVPEECEFRAIDNAVFATDLEKGDPYLIWKTAEMLEPFDPVLRCLHIEQKKQVEPQLSIDDLEEFFTSNAPNLSIKFYDLLGENITQKILEFSEVFRVDLILMHSPRRSFFNRLFHKSQTGAMARHSNIPLWVIR